MNKTTLEKRPAEATAGTWSQVVRLIEEHPDVKQVRLNLNEHSVSVGFYETPSEETLNEIQAAVRAGLSGQCAHDSSAQDRRLHDGISSRSPTRRATGDLATHSVTEVAEPSIPARRLS
jgi:hypothetical protein